MSASDLNTKDRLLEAACHIFAERGYEKASLRDICEAAGVNNAAVNYHFDGKKGLYVETIKLACGGRSILDEVPDWSEDVSPKEKLYDFIRSIMSRMLDAGRPQHHHQLMMHEIARGTPSEATAELVRSYIKRDHDFLMNLLDELVGKKLPKEQKHLIIFSMIGQCMYFRVGKNIATLLITKRAFEKLNAEKLAKHVCNFTLAALGAEPPII